MLVPVLRAVLWSFVETALRIETPGANTSTHAPLQTHNRQRRQPESKATMEVLHTLCSRSTAPNSRPAVPILHCILLLRAEILHNGVPAAQAAHPCACCGPGLYSCTHATAAHQLE
jgi:hypothetical protein